jgi:uncharacterized membrane protein
VFTQSVFWLWFAGLTFLFAGLIVARKEWVAASGFDKLIALGPVFVAAPLACFGAEHFTAAHDIMQLVPAWMPAHLFWAYFVGCAWFAAALSLVAMKFVRLSATLLGVAFFLFVFMMDLPFAVTHPAERLGWTLALRESAFAAGAWALAGSQGWGPNARKQNWMILIGRFIVSIAVIRFGVENLLHPEILPGVPDSKITPTWIPLHTLWGYPVGALLLVAGVALLLNIRSRLAAASTGALMTLLTIFLYVPILAVAKNPPQMVDALNFVFDTLMFGGTALLVAQALPERPA